MNTEKSSSEFIIKWTCPRSDYEHDDGSGNLSGSLIPCLHVNETIVSIKPEAGYTDCSCLPVVCKKCYCAVTLTLDGEPE